jgi:hypothetical protein
MLRRVPADLPLFGALLFGLALSAFGYSGLYAEVAFGRPSSTASLAFLFLPIWGGLAAIVGLILGFVVRAVWRRVADPEAGHRTSALIAILAIAIATSIGAGVLNVIQHEQEAQPGIRFDDGGWIREFRADSGKPVRTSTTLYDGPDSKTAVLSWSRNHSRLLLDDGSLVLSDVASGKSARFPITALDYITRVDAVPLLTTRDPPRLAIVISGRATGRRALVAVVDENYKVVFEELVAKFWELRSVQIEVRVSPAMDEYAVVGPQSYESIILRRKPRQ